MSNSTHPALLVHPAGFVNTFPELKVEHVKVQRGFFGTARTAHLSEDKEQQLAGINALLGLNISSRTQLSPDAYAALIAAIEAGAFNQDWTLTGRVHAEVEIHLVATPIEETDEKPEAVCVSCKERTVRYFYEDSEKEGFCRECMAHQGEDETELMYADIAAYKELVCGTVTLEEFEELCQELDRALELETAREAALAPIVARAEQLRTEINAYGIVLNAKEAFHSRHTIRKLRDAYFAAQGHLARLEREYPFI